MTDDELRAHLLARIAARRSEVAAFLRRHRPRYRRRTNVTLALSSLAAIFTAGPAVGGGSFATAAQKALSLPDDSYVWRSLCFGALLVSAGAAVMTTIGKNQEATGQLSAAEAANAELEGLAGLIEFGHLGTDDAAKLYHQYTVKIPFVESSLPAPSAPGLPVQGGPPAA